MSEIFLLYIHPNINAIVLLKKHPVTRNAGAVLTFLVKAAFGTFLITVQ